MPNIANELFLLSTNLSQFKSKVLIIKVFIESLNSIFLQQNFEWKETGATCIGPCIKVCTVSKTYGYIQYANQDLFSEEAFSMFQNAVQLLGVYLEKLEQELLLKNQKEHLDFLVVEKTQQLQNSQKELENKKAEIERQNIELKQRNSFIETILDNLPIGLAVNNIDTSFAFYVNKKLEEIYGWPKEEISSVETFFKNVYPDEKYREKIMSRVIRDIQSGDPSRMHWENIEITTSEGKKKYVNAVNIPLFDQNIMVSTVIDVTDLYKTQIELTKAKDIAESNEIIKSKMVANIGDVIVIIDKKGMIRYESPNMEKLFGWENRKFIGKPIIENIHPKHLKRFNLFLNDLIAFHNKTGSVEIKYKHKDEHYSWIQFTACNLLDDNVIKGILCNFHDITDQKNFEKQIIEKNNEYESLNEELRQTNEELFFAKEKAEEASRLKTEFLNNMSHEVRTPMNGIMGFSELLGEPGMSLEKRKYYTKIVQNSSQQLLRIIDDILEISSLETQQQSILEESFCLNDLLMELFSIYDLKSKERNIPIYLKKAFSDEKSYIISDKTKLSRILGNLVENALKFTTSGYIEVGYAVEGEKLILYVKDTGIGISPQNLEGIFERFSQEEKEISSKHSGLGLGLSISKENAKLLGGDITVESEKGKGSVFYVNIPYKHDESKDFNEPEEAQTQKSGEYIILVAEDEEVNFLYIEALFEIENRSNFKIIHAHNGKEAVDICLKDKNIDLVLMDIKMPLMNGHEATEKIKAIFPDLPIIAQTAYSTEADKKLAFEHGCDAFISKPLDNEKLFGLINRYLPIQ